MISRFLSGSAATFVLSAAVLAQSPTTDQAPVAVDPLPSVAEVQPDLTLAPVPSILQLHLPMLGPNLGVLVESVAPGSAAEKTGLRSGDVILEAGGRRVTAGASTAPMDPAFPIVVIRRGRVQMLQSGMPRHEFFGWNNAFGGQQPRFDAGMFGGPPVGFPNHGSARSSTSVTSSASSSSFGDRSVSISRSGDQISLEMSLPNLAQGPIRLQGTAAEIEQQLQSGPMTESAKREVRAALRQAR